MTREEIKHIYSELVQKHEAELSALRKRQLLISVSRLVVFVGGILVSAIAFTWFVAAGITGLLITIALFLVLIRAFIKCSETMTLTENLIKISRNEVLALEWDLSKFDNGSDLNPIDHEFAGDIDLFGEGSLFCYLNRTVTGPGRRILAKTLLDPYSLKGEIADRQAAIKELSAKLSWRQQFAAIGLDKRLDEDEIKGLDDWLNGKEDFFASEFIRILSFFLPISAVSVLLFVIAGILPVNAFLAIFLLDLFLEGIFIKRINRIHEAVSKKHSFLSSLGKLIRIVDSEPFSAPLLARIREKICSEKESVSDRISELDDIIKAFDTRLNMLVGAILNGLLLWDFHCVRRLEKWRQSVSSSLPEWLNQLGELDAFNSFSNFAFNNPDYVFPVAVADKPVLSAAAMGHPLLPEETRVCNDFSVDSRGLVCIITGANMAGKSTFLRTVAVNLLLAMAGAPVCATKMIFSPLRIFTSMRTTDSLTKNESYFYAELKRLRTLKEMIEKGEDCLFILDEILKGTNSTDKSLGSKVYLKHLIGLKATGLIATHDISLGEMEETFPGSVINKCFEIEINGEEISFDYLLRDGITRKMNASLLMKQMGIV